MTERGEVLTLKGRTCIFSGSYWYTYRNGRSGAHPKVIRSCKGCGDSFFGKKEDEAGNRGAFCSSSCYGTYCVGENNPAWITGTPNYHRAHSRMRRIRGPASAHLCYFQCGKQASDWARVHELDGEDPEDYIPLCRSCHAKYDGKGHWWRDNPQAQTPHCRTCTCEAEGQ